MAITLSNESQIQVDGQIVGQLTAWDYTETDTQVDTTNFDSTAEREYMELGLLDGDVNITANFDLSSTGQDTLRASLASGAEVAWRVFPEGITIGKPRIYGDMIVGSVSVSADGVDGLIVATFSCKLLNLAENTVT